MFYEQQINGTVQPQQFNTSNYNNQNQFDHYNPPSFNEAQDNFYNLSGTNNYNETQREFYNLPSTPSIDTTPNYITPSYTPSYTPMDTTPLQPTSYVDKTFNSNLDTLYNQPSYLDTKIDTTPNYLKTDYSTLRTDYTIPNHSISDYKIIDYSTPDYSSTPSYLNNPIKDDYNINSGPGLFSSDHLYGQFNTGGNLHDTFKVDRYDNLYNKHTTVDLGNNKKIHLGYD